MIPIAAFFSTISMLGFLLAWWSRGASIVSFGLLTVVAVTLLLLLLGGYRRLSARRQMLPEGHRWARWHLALHLIPLSYLAMGFITELTLPLNALYLLPLMLFFWSGRCTWRALYRRFGARMYRIFFMGNTALLVWSPVLLALALANDELFGDRFAQIQQLYFTIHFLIAGAALVKIERDLLANPD